MAERVINVCDRCGEDIVYDVALGDENAGAIETRYPAYTILEEVCSACMKKQLAMHKHRFPSSYKGTAMGEGRLYALPHKTEEPPPGGEGSVALPVPPRFQS